MSIKCFLLILGITELIRIGPVLRLVSSNEKLTQIWLNRIILNGVGQSVSITSTHRSPQRLNTQLLILGTDERKKMIIQPCVVESSRQQIGR